MAKTAAAAAAAAAASAGRSEKGDAEQEYQVPKHMNKDAIDLAQLEKVGGDRWQLDR